MQTTNMLEFVEHFSEYISFIKKGEDILILESGTPVAKIVPLEQDSKKRKFGTLPELEMSEDFDAPLSDDFAFPFGKTEK